MNQEIFTLVSGVGNFDDKKACIMSAAVAKWRMSHGEPLGKATDDLECVCPVIRAFAIRVNDAYWWRDDAERTEVLTPFVDRILDTKDALLTPVRMFMVADAAVRNFAPMALDTIGHKEDAEKLRTLPPIVDKETAIVGRDVARAAAAAYVAAAAAAADAAADAAYAAAAAYVAAAAAAADAAADAADAAYAAYAADAAAAADAAYAAAAAYVAAAAAYVAYAAAAAAAADAADAAYAAYAADAAAAADAYVAAAAAARLQAKLPARAAALELLSKLCEVRS